MAMNLDHYVQETFSPFAIPPLPDGTPRGPEDIPPWLDINPDRPLPIWHLDGVPWHKADTPRRLHRCWVQTHTRLDGEIVDRCACGGLRYDGFGPWIFRNENRPGFWARLLRRVMP